jgi:eukaryotic-like serine/threonine-protein kinase
LVPELIEGVPLDEYCSSRRLSINARLDFCGKVCTAMQHAHQRLVIHRDLKPGNILVDNAGEPKLLDFGIAKVVDPEHRETGWQTQEMRLPTPRYASPEQLRNAVVTAASDIYSLGVIFYELLAERHPFPGPFKSAAEMTKATLELEPEPGGYDSS